MRISLSAILLLIACGTAAASPQPPSVAATALATVAPIHGTWNAPPRGIPTGGIPGGPLLGNGDLGISMAGAPQNLQFYIGKSDFFGVIRGGMMPVGSLILKIPSLQGGSYHVQQNIGPATVTGEFKTSAGADCVMQAWVAHNENVTVLTFKNKGTSPLKINSQLLDGFGTAGNSATYSQTPQSTSLRVSPDTVDFTLGNRVHGGGAAPFDGTIAGLKIYSKALTPQQVSERNSDGALPSPYFSLTQESQGTARGQAAWSVDPIHGLEASFPGDNSSRVNLGAMRMPQARFTVTAWIKPQTAATGNAFIVTAMSDSYSPRWGRLLHGLAFGLRDGKLSARLNTTVLTAPNAIASNQWTKAAVAYDGSSMKLFADGKLLASTSDFPTAQDVMGWDQSAVHFGDPAVPYDGCGPKGLLEQHVLGVPVTEDSQSLFYTVPVGGKVTVLLSCVTNRNTSLYAQSAHDIAAHADIPVLYKKHAAWWNHFWSQSYVTLTDKPVQDDWYGSLYIYACCSRPDCPPPGLWGNFITQRQVGWQGDYTLDYNAEAPPWAAYATNHFSLADNYEAPLIAYLPRGRAIALHHNQHGLRFYTHLIPPPGWDDDPSKFMGQKVGLLFGCVDCAMRWRYQRNRTYAKRVYPLLKGAADFWDHYLVLQNGYYMDPNDGADEFVRHDENPATTLAFLRLVYPALIQMSEALHVDSNLRPEWRQVLDHLSPLPIVPAATVDNVIGHPSSQTLAALLGPGLVQNKQVIRQSLVGTGFPNPMALQTNASQRSTSAGMNSTQVIFPGWQVGLESNSQKQQAALNTVTLAAEWYDYNDDCTFYPAAADAGYDPATIFQHLDQLIQSHGSANFAILTGGGGIEDVAIVPGALAAMFQQSYQQDIHLFPNWPSDENASFGNIPACRGFLLSSQIIAGKISCLQIRSTLGLECRVDNPWPGQKVFVVSKHRKTLVLQTPLLVFPTIKGEDILLTPD